MKISKKSPRVSTALEPVVCEEMAGIDNSFQSGSFGVDMAKAANLRGSGGPDRKSRRAGAPAPFFARVQDLNNAVASEDNDFNSEHSRGQSFLATQNQAEKRADGEAVLFSDDLSEGFLSVMGSAEGFAPS
eukprot:1387369-Amorphochlora_amoeboformis.AAC.1